jgi:3-isopropylmalate dehydrogenase
MKILVLPGDGIGPEITAATLQVLRAADAALSCGLGFERRDIGLASLRAEGTTLPKAVLERVPEVDGVLLGPVSHLDYPTRQEGGLNPSAELRTRFQLFANIRPCRSREGLTLLRKPMDLVIVRENTEGFYADRNMFEGSGEFAPEPDMALSLRKVTAKGSRRVAKAAFRLASRRRRKVTAVHKANIMKFTDGLFLQVAQEIAKEHPDIQFNDRIVDNMSMQLVQNPKEYDVIVLPNLYGDILSDLAAGLVGGLGLAPGANLGDEIALFEATHGSAPKYAGTNRINPMAMMLSGVMMLHHLGETYAANMLEGAIAETIREGKTVTYDMKAERNDPSAVGTTQVTDAIVARLEKARTPTTI